MQDLISYSECYQSGAKRLRDAGVPEPETDARLLLEFVCGTDYNTLLAHGEIKVSREKEVTYEALIKRREKREPLQLLTGEQDFCGLTFQVNRHVLIPRQDTEILVEYALKRLKSGMKLLDMCTGSGCILISLLAMAENVHGTGADISKEALFVAEENGRRLLPEDKQPQWVLSDLFSAMQGRFDMIVSNPPYIPSGEICSLMPEVRDFEPAAALDGGGDGLLFYENIVRQSGAYLKENGWLVFEIGCTQGEAVSGLLKEAGFAKVEIIKDYAGLDRVVAGQRNGR
ncbi:MAG: peptide chain release factor N(5)-glutamine methyltransferase [Lachnospiraceae bacterium]|nr:peptide chain release factor N(5)-glutamine methyltransferase [Lachnospiraceae bacterium]